MDDKDIAQARIEETGPKPGSQTFNQAGDCDAVFSYQKFRDHEHATEHP